MLYTVTLDTAGLQSLAVWFIRGILDFSRRHCQLLRDRSSHDASTFLYDVAIVFPFLKAKEQACSNLESLENIL